MLLNVLRYPGRCRTASRQTASSRTPACQGRETALFKVPVGGGCQLSPFPEKCVRARVGVRAHAVIVIDTAVFISSWVFFYLLFICSLRRFVLNV